MISKIGRRDFLKLMALLGTSTLLPPVTAASPATATTHPNILILVFDALSAQDMSLYGFPRATTPNLARFAQRATVYHQHHANGNFTVPGVASLLTGNYPWQHRAFHLAGQVIPYYKTHNIFAVFKEKGFQTIAYPQNPWVALQLEQLKENITHLISSGKFCVSDERFYDIFTKDKNIAYRSFEDLIFSSSAMPASLFLSWFDRLNLYTQQQNIQEQYQAEYPYGITPIGRYRLLCHLNDSFKGIQHELGATPAPFLAYFHLYPPHDPYVASQDFIGIFADQWQPIEKPPHIFSDGFTQTALQQWRREYNEYIAYTDAQFGIFYEWMAQNHILDNTYVIITSDHGEMFERGIWRHTTPTLYEAIVHVPLIISAPGQQQRNDVYAPTNAIDILPTLLSFINAPIPAWCAGQSLLPFENLDNERNIFIVEAKSNAVHAPLQRATLSLIKGKYKIIYYTGYAGLEDQYELYDLHNDPEEMHNLFATKQNTAQELKHILNIQLEEVNAKVP